MKKLYECQIKLTYYCMAEDATTATSFALDAVTDNILSEHVTCNIMHKDQDDLNSNWDLDSIPYGEKKRTIKQILEEKT